MLSRSRGEQFLGGRTAIDGQQAGKLLGMEGLPQAVTAEQEAVATEQLIAHLVEFEAGAGTDGAGDHVRLRVALSLLQADRLRIDHFLHETMIVGNLLYQPVAQQVGARVPGPQTGKMITAREQHDNGGGHDRAGPALCGLGQEPPDAHLVNQPRPHLDQ